jgi:tetratricopeptide (TPR) repeat protein
MIRGSTARVTFTRILQVALGLIYLLTFIAMAQTTGVRGSGPVDLRDNPGALLKLPTYYSTAPGTGVLIFSVYAERNTTRLDRQALLKLINVTKETAVWQTTEDTSKGVFTDIPYGKYEVEVSAVGYLSTHKDVTVAENFGPAQIEIVLHRDPAALNLDVANAVLSSKARKQAKRAVSALKSANLKDAQKHLDEAYKAAPTSAELNFLLGYLYFEKKDFSQAGTYLSTAVNLSPRNVQSLTLLGRTGLERQDYPAARSALEQAIMADPENWLPHNLLADTHLHERNYDKARDEAQIAITKGKSAANPAQLVLGEALVGLGHDEEGIQALNHFLHESPSSLMAAQVRNLIAQVQNHPLSSTPAEATASTEARLAGVDPMRALPPPGLSVKMWHPPDIDEVQPALASGVGCPSDKVIDESGKHAQELVKDAARFSAIEELFHQPLDDFGNAARTETRKYDYVASISEPEPGFFDVDEYRAAKITLDDYPGHIASTGFAGLAFVFHPHVRDHFDMKCEGLGDWHGQAAWLVHFRQRDDRPNSMLSYKVGNQIYPVKLKGRAWITADKFQIVRIEAEMLQPMPEIQLLTQHQIVEYGPVPFEQSHISLWLPKTAEIYSDFRKQRYYRRHSFDHYMLFSVDSIEKRKEPGTKPADKPDLPEKNTDH